MKLPLSWLKKYASFSVTPEKMAELFTMSGTAVGRVEKKDGEAVLDIEVTTNRPDCLSVLGLAAEAAALTDAKVKRPTVYHSKESAKKSHLAFQIRLEDKNGCPFYTARLLRGASIQASPAEVQKFLSLAGARPINNAVDATNFVLLESGQPLHAFDLDKIKGAVVVIRAARKGEKFLGLDGVEYTLDAGTLVIADSEKPIAIAGVIGGKLTEVTPQTKNILLESAYFDPVRVRQASKRYKISTESSYRFERGVDPETVATASRRTAELMKDWTGAKDESGLVMAGRFETAKKSDIVLRESRVEKLLGYSIPQKRMLQILKQLGFSVHAAGKGRLRVECLHSRRDVTQEADLIEEILRIEGFENIGSTLPTTRYAENGVDAESAERLQALQRFVASLGFDEIVSYSLFSEKSVKDTGLDPLGCHRIVNALSAEQQFFRPSLLPGMLQSIAFNAHRKASALKFFEIGNRYAGAKEEMVLSIAIYGEFENHWRRKTESSFHDLKGVLENVFDFLGVKEIQWKSARAPWSDATADMILAGKSLGQCGSVLGSVLSRWDIPKTVFYAELSLDAPLKKGKQTFRVRTVPKYPSVRRDVAFIIDENIAMQDLADLMKQSGSPFLQEVTLFDEYKGKNIVSGKRSLAFSLAYQKDTGTFTDQEIEGLQKRVGDSLKNRYSVEFR